MRPFIQITHPESMAREVIKTICFFSRRYDDLLDESVFEQKFYNQYFWVKYLDSSLFKIIWIFGSSKNKTVKHDLGSIHFLKDVKRTNPFLQKLSLYKKSKDLIEKSKVDVVFCNGINDILSHYLLAKKLNSKIPVLVQDHATVFKKKYTFVPSFFNKINGFIFNSEGLEKEWVASNLITKEKLYFLPEGVSEFQVSDKNTARNITNMQGDPILLWIGNLSELKDPMSCLKGIAEIVKEKPDLRLYMIYQRSPLKLVIDEFIENKGLKNNIVLLGAINHNEIEAYFQSADYYISSSLKEGSGYAAIEAMACNVIPILSDIPSFKHFTKNGEIGSMFKQGQALDIKNKVLHLMTKDQNLVKQELAKYYNANFSPEALANKFTMCIQSVLNAS